MAFKEGGGPISRLGDWSPQSDYLGRKIGTSLMAMMRSVRISDLVYLRFDPTELIMPLILTVYSND